MPAKDAAHDVAGIDLIAGQGTPLQSTTHAEIQLKQNAAGNVSAVLNVDFAGAGAASNFVTGSSLTVNATVNGKPFTRMPSNCSPGPSSLTVTYSDGKTETTPATPDFNIVGCSSLPYAPKFSASLIKDAHDDGVEVVTTITQAPDEAATATNSLKLPWPALGSNLSALALQCPTAPCSKPVGSVTATSPLLPAPLTGSVYLTGDLNAPTLTLLFPPPNALKLVGTVTLSTSTVTFNGVPDVPQTGLVVRLFGGPQAVENATCAPPNGTAVGGFTGQNGSTVTVSQPVSVTGCPPPKPSVSSASLSGLAKRKPVLKVQLARATYGPKLKAFTLAVPTGLRFNAKGLRRGVTIRGARHVSLRGGKLIVQMKQAVATISVKLTSPLLVAKKHGNKHPKLHLAVTDASGRTTKLTAST